MKKWEALIAATWRLTTTTYVLVLNFLGRLISHICYDLFLQIHKEDHDSPKRRYYDQHSGFSHFSSPDHAQTHSHYTQPHFTQVVQHHRSHSPSLFAPQPQTHLPPHINNPQKQFSHNPPLQQHMSSSSSQISPLKRVKHERDCGGANLPWLANMHSQSFPPFPSNSTTSSSSALTLEDLQDLSSFLSSS